MAPEQLNVKKYGIDEKISCNLDLWALGVTIYEVYTGKVLFKNRDNDSNEEIMANILAPGLQDKIVQLPQPLLDIVRRCLVKDARRRAHGAEELMELLNNPVVAAPQPSVEITPDVPAAAKPEMGDLSVNLDQEERQAPEVRLRPEMRLIPEAKIQTQDLFKPEKSWVWAEAVSAPLMEEPTQTVELSGTPKRWNTGLSIAIVAAAVLVFITSYIVVHSHRMTEALHSTNVTVVNPVKPQRADLVKNTVAKVPATNEGAAVSDATVRTAVAPVTEEEAYDENGEHVPALAPAKYVLLLTTPRTCSIHINDTPYGVLRGGKTMKVYLAPGIYTIEAAGTGNNHSISSRKLVVRQNNLNHWHKYRIRL